ncbi:hypothetical protein E1281_18425 [Actinomadura sp. KC345]|uniref:hypothetical protein n=1 Tax=Actinomadura sp. KC345 TaxID=2530371 RepID=UPI001051C483|nr:hypothetical protein [Actinomadura sp. KC345]TDC52863.1 hypothetical protein E1281_18425 [Actinomadura sp. KC345]
MGTADTAVRASGRRNEPAQIPANLRLHSPEEAAHILGEDVVTPSWIREKARKREIDFVLIAGKVALTDDNLLALVKQHEVKATGAEQRAAAPRRRPAAKVGGTAVTALRARQPKRRSA